MNAIYKIFDNNKIFNIILTVTILFIFISRLSLLNKGHMHFADELRYRYAFRTMDEIAEGKYRHGLSNLFRAYNRPGFILLSMVTCSIQRIFDNDVGRLDNPEHDDLRTYFIPSLVNLISTIAIIFMMYLFLLYFTKDRFISFSGMVIYSLLNTNIMELRHMTPYYWAEIFFLLIIYKIIRLKVNREYSAKELISFGILTSLAFNVYPGYYNLALLVAGLIFFTGRNKLRIAVLFLCSFLLPIVIFEAISRYAELPYLFENKKLKAMYDALPTNPQEKWDFVWIIKYMLGIEGIMGGILLAFSVAWLALDLPRRSTNNKVKIVYCLILIHYAFIVTMIYTLGKFTLRTKYCHPFIFFIVLSVFLLINRVKRFRLILIAALLVLSSISYIYYYGQYLEAVYPRDLRQLVREKYPDKKIINTAEFYDKNTQMAQLYLANRDGYDFLGVNLRTIGRAVNKGHNPIDLPEENLLMSYPMPEQVYGPYTNSALSFSKERGGYKMRIYRLR